jgi:hypothetical protein
MRFQNVWLRRGLLPNRAESAVVNLGSAKLPYNR